MKKIIFLIHVTIILSVFSNQNYAQNFNDDSTRFFTSFENEWTFIEFDPSEGNIWQVGVPSKIKLDSAYSVPFAILTDTINLISEPTRHSFTLKLSRPSYSNAVFAWVLYFKHKYSFDSTNSGGLIEVSYNKGVTWNNILNDDTLDVGYFTHFYSGEDSIYVLPYSINDTLTNGEQAITGLMNDEYWHNGQIEANFQCTFSSAALVYDIWIRFTYINLGTNNSHEGWLIDNIDFWLNHWCEYLDDNIINISPEFQAKLIPNPAVDYLFFELNNQPNEKINILLYDTFGNLVLDKLDFNIEETLNVSFLKKGIYFIRIYNKKNYYTCKLLKE